MVSSYDFASGQPVWRGDSDVRNGLVVGDAILFTRGLRVYVDRFR